MIIRDMGGVPDAEHAGSDDVRFGLWAEVNYIPRLCAEKSALHGWPE